MARRRVTEMKTYKVELVAGVEMVGDDPHPPTLTTAVRPNFVVDGHYCLCFIIETTPANGIAMHSRGAFKAHVVCAEDALPLFVKGGQFELRSGPRVFATGRLREIMTIDEAEATP